MKLFKNEHDSNMKGVYQFLLQNILSYPCHRWHELISGPLTAVVCEFADAYFKLSFIFL